MFSDPEHNIEQFGLQSGFRVADLGSGSGFYSMSAAKAVGDKGRVYAVDVQKDLLDRLKKEASHKGILNIDIVWGDVEKIGGTKLSDSSVDAVIVANLLFQLDDKTNVALEIKRILRAGGRVLVVDWLESFAGMGPAPESVIGQKTAEEMFKKVGFSLERSIRAGAHHWGIIMKKA